MSDRYAIVVEAAAELRQLMYGSVASAGYRVIGVERAQELASQVHRSEFLTAQTSLLVLNAELCQVCALPLAVAACQRWQLQLPRIKVVLIHEWGTLGTVEQPQLEHCELIALLEKPFALTELEQIAALALARVA